jgi:hypothetical protein
MPGDCLKQPIYKTLKKLLGNDILLPMPVENIVCSYWDKGDQRIAVGLLCLYVSQHEAKLLDDNGELAVERMRIWFANLADKIHKEPGAFRRYARRLNNEVRAYAAFVCELLRQMSTITEEQVETLVRMHAVLMAESTACKHGNLDILCVDAASGINEVLRSAYNTEKYAHRNGLPPIQKVKASELWLLFDPTWSRF